MFISKVSLAAVAAAFMLTSAQAADLIVADPMIDMASPTEHDLYVGVLGSVGRDPVSSYGGVGIVIGVDFDVNETFFLGADARAAAYWDNVGYSGAEGVVRGRLGLHATDAVDFYLAAGVGHFAAAAGGVSYNLNEIAVGAEFDVSEDLAVRAELAGSGPIGTINTYQANLGLLWKF